MKKLFLGLSLLLLSHVGLGASKSEAPKRIRSEARPRMLIRCPKCNLPLIPPIGAPYFSCPCGQKMMTEEEEKRIRRACQRQWARVLAGSADIEGMSVVHQVELSRPLQQFFLEYPGLTKQIAGIMIRFVNPKTAGDFPGGVKEGSARKRLKKE